MPNTLYQTKIMTKLKALAKERGFHQLTGVQRDALINGLEAYDRANGVVPLAFKKKKKIGQGCEGDAECVTQNCDAGQCGKSLVQRARNLKPLVEENPVVSKRDRRKKECYTMNNVEVKEHQQRVARFLRQSDAKGLIVFHSVGSGKTLTAIAAAKCCVAMRPELRIIIIVPSSVAMQFKKEVKQAGLSRELEAKLNVYSHKTWLDRFKAGLVNARDAMLIVDEAHTFRKQIVSKKGEANDDVLTDGSEEYGKSYAETLHRACMQASKVMLLTATPLVNSAKDLRNYLAMISQTPLKDEYNAFFRGLKND